MMPIALKAALERLALLAPELSPEEQDYAAQQLTALVGTLKYEPAWDALLASPEAQASLVERGQKC